MHTVTLRSSVIALLITYRLPSNPSESASTYVEIALREISQNSIQCMYIYIYRQVKFATKHYAEKSTILYRYSHSVSHLGCGLLRELLYSSLPSSLAACQSQ